MRFTLLDQIGIAIAVSVGILTLVLWILEDCV